MKIRLVSDGYFTKEDAEALVGKRVRSLCEYLDVPLGTTGTVTGIENFKNIFPDVYWVNVTWDVPPDEHGEPICDGFTRTTYKNELEEI